MNTFLIYKHKFVKFTNEKKETRDYSKEFWK